MSDYVLFGTTISFDDEAERFFDIQWDAWQAAEKAVSDFKSWYSGCGNIEAVLKNYEQKAGSLVINYANQPLFETLPNLGIYDISEAAYDEQCFDLADVKEALDRIAGQYNAILDDQESAIQYRAERKESRGRVEGGGFGVGGALKGMATAGAMNAVSGAGHSIVNAIGNAGSAIAASSAKKSLYRDEQTLEILANGVKDNIYSAFNEHIQMINDIEGGYFVSSFDSDKATAYFENAKKVSEKAQNLLIESVKYCPWSYKVLSYIFAEYGAERRHIWDISVRFHVDLRDAVEEALAHEYTEEAQQSEEAAQEAKLRITQIMGEYGVQESPTFDRLEQDCIQRLCAEYDDPDENIHEWVLTSISNYIALDKNKAAVIYRQKIWELAQQYQVDFTDTEIEEILATKYTPQAKASEKEALCAKQKIKEIMYALHVEDSATLNKLETDCLGRICPDCSCASETMCNTLLLEINKYDALPKNKQPFIDALQKRIEEIWTEEDSAVFAELYKQTPLNDLSLIEQNKKIVDETGRTSKKTVFIEALSCLNEANVLVAAKYAVAKEKGTFASLFNFGKEDMYMKLTCGGTVLHPAIENAVAELNAEKEKNKGKGLFGVFGAKKAPKSPEKSDNTATRFCTGCGNKLSADAKFCANCGKKQ